MKSHFTTKVSWLGRWLAATAILAISAPLVFAEDNPIASVQQSLKEKHFYFGEIDGIWNDATQGALLRFQYRNGLQGTGEIDAPTLQTLAGNPAPAKAAVVSDARAEVDRWCARLVERNDNPVVAKAAVGNIEFRTAAPELSPRDQGNIPSVLGTEKFPSWSALHGGTAQESVEVRRAIPVSSKAGDDDDRFIPRAILVSYPDSVEKVDSSNEGVTMVPAHFSGQDGHVYTYYKQVRIASPEETSARAYNPLVNSVREGSAALPVELSRRSDNRATSFAGR